MQETRDQLAIVKYYDTSTTDGLTEQLLDSISTTIMLSHESLSSIVVPFTQLRKRIQQREKEQYLLNSGDLDYLEKQDEIHNTLRDLMKVLNPPDCIEKNNELLTKFKNQWGNAIQIDLAIVWKVKKHAKKKFILSPCDTVQYQQLTCWDLLENFKFIERIPLNEAHYVPVKEEGYQILIRTINPILEERVNFRKSHQYTFFSTVNNHPVAFVTLVIFLSLLMGLAAGCAVECVTNELGTGLCI